MTQKHCLFACCFIFCGLLSFYSCSKVDANLKIEDTDNYKPGDSTICTPIFNVGVNAYRNAESLTSKQADELEHLKENAILHILFYKKDQYPDQHPVYYKSIFRVKKSGDLTPVYNDIQIPKGIYNVYFLSTNHPSKDLMPDFHPYQGMARYLYNGIDYIWGEALNIEIDQSSVHTHLFTLSHMTSLQQFDFKTTDSQKLTINRTTISAPTEDECSWSILTGLISQAKTLSSAHLLTISQTTASSYFLPAEISQDLRLRIEATIGEKKQNYELSIPAPAGQILQFGQRYQYTILLTPDGASLL